MPLYRTTFKRLVRYYLRTPRKIAKHFISIFFRLRGVDLLTHEETMAFLKPNLVSVHEDDHIVIPDVKNCSDIGGVIFKQREAISHRAFVWSYTSGKSKATQLPHGAIFVQSKVLCTDFNQSGFYQSLLNANKRTSRSVKTLIGPWSQYSDGIIIGGYYDFVINIAAKLCRVKESIDAAEFSEAVIAYPLFGTTYEYEYLNLLDIKPSQLEDSRYCKIEFEKVILCNSGDWTYPNSSDILLLKQYVENKVKVKRSAKNRIYISRSGRRCVQNESELIELLRKFDFTIIEDKPRSLVEQIEIYSNASFVLGPHGASFMNIIWCEPGTHLFEMFSPNYKRDHYVYLAKIMSMEYSAYSYKAGDTNDDIPSFLLQDMIVSIPELESCLSRIFRLSEVTHKKS